MGKRAVGLGLVVLACVAMAGCGSDKKRLSAAELTTQGDAVCARLQSDVTALADSFPVSINFTPAQMQDFYKKILPLVDKAVAGFKALAPPKDLEDAYDSALVQAGIDRKTLAGGTNSPTAAQRLFEAQVDPFTATGQKLAAAGIKGCEGTAGTGGGATGSPTTAAPGSPSSTGAATTATTTK